MSHLVDQSSILLASIDELTREIEASSDAMLWTVQGTILNSIGTLGLHLVGNLRHFIGATLGGTGYVRDRATEFAQRDVAKDALLEMIADTRHTVATTLASMREADLEAPFPLETFGAGRTTGYVLVTLIAHLKYHVGQINYARRMQE